MNAPAPSLELPCEARQRTDRALVAGCGYLGLAVARQLYAAGWEVLGLTRSAASAAMLAGEPFTVLACDIAEPTAVERLGRPGAFDVVIHTASSGHRGAEVYRRVFVEGTRHLLGALRPPRFILTGSTSVYAQRDGLVVTEESPAEPLRETGRLLLEAERLALEAGGTVARLAGIYGPERWALKERFLSGEARLEGDGARWINQIHRADAASALVFLLAAPGGIYNVSDGCPVSQREVYSAFAEHFRRPLPPLVPPDFTRKRGWSHKRVSNAKLVGLGWRPMFPSFRAAL